MKKLKESYAIEIKKRANTIFKLEVEISNLKFRLFKQKPRLSMKKSCQLWHTRRKELFEANNCQFLWLQIPVIHHLASQEEDHVMPSLLPINSTTTLFEDFWVSPSFISKGYIFPTIFYTVYSAYVHKGPFIYDVSHIWGGGNLILMFAGKIGKRDRLKLKLLFLTQ